MGKIAFLFPGQGAQSVGMGKNLAECNPEIADLFKQADDVLDIPLSQIMFEGPNDQLTLTENTQPALVVTALAAHRLLTLKTGIQADYVAGHSLGEYAAISVAGGFSFQTAIELVRLRGQAMQKSVPPGEGSMAAMLNMKPELVEMVCEEASKSTGEICVPANYNTSAQIVISGHKKAVDQAISLAKVQGAKRCIPLQVSAPFHCPLMQPAADTMQSALNAIKINDLTIPLIANVTADKVTNGDTVSKLLVQQVTGAVRWQASIEKLIQLGVDTFIELGSGNVLTGMMKRIDKKVRALTFNGPDDLEKITTTLQ